MKTSVTASSDTSIITNQQEYSSNSKRNQFELEAPYETQHSQEAIQRKWVIAKNMGRKKRGLIGRIFKNSSSDGEMCKDEPPILTLSFREDLDKGEGPSEVKVHKGCLSEMAAKAVKMQLEKRDPDSKPPSYMFPSPTIVKTDFQMIKVSEIICEKATLNLGKEYTAKEMAIEHSKENGCIVFVIRRPGCALCREQALYLKYLFQNHPKETEGFGVCGIVKDFGDMQGLSDFHNDYFPFPLYVDEKEMFYQALGSRLVTTKRFLALMNPFGNKVWMRLKTNKIKGNVVGEGFLQGGVLLFSENGETQYIYEEETGFELPVGGIAAAMTSMRHGTSMPACVRPENKKAIQACTSCD